MLGAGVLDLLAGCLGCLSEIFGGGLRPGAGIFFDASASLAAASRSIGGGFPRDPEIALSSRSTMARLSISFRRTSWTIDGPSGTMS